MNFDVSDSNFHDWMIDRGMSENSARTYSQAIKGIWPNDPGGWLKRKSSGSSPGSLTVYRAAIRKWIRFNGGDPSKYALKGRTQKAKRKAPRPLTDGQLNAYRKCAQALPDAYRMIALLLPATGLRISECCGLKLSQVERRKNRIALVFEGKGEHERRVYLGATMRREFVAYLKKMGPAKKSGWLFQGNKGNHVSSERVRQYLREISHKIGIYVYPHLLRHTYATNLHEKGNSVRVIQAALGHASAKTTMRYIHPTDSELIAAADSIE
tara:strand:+ start:1138 stop:1941 length:804 start_codon:yes stop_codon:yes gene_type:complete